MNRSKAYRADHEIVDLYWARSEMAIHETDRKYRRLLFSVITNILADARDGEECISDTYLGAWNAMPPARPQVLPAFLTRIARNRAVSRYRSNGAAKRIPTELTASLEELDEIFGGEDNVEAQAELNRMATVLNRYLASLSAESRVIFVSRYYCADPVERIAAMLGISQATVFRRLTAMRRDLKQQLEREGVLL